MYQYSCDTTCLSTIATSSERREQFIVRRDCLSFHVRRIRCDFLNRYCKETVLQTQRPDFQNHSILAQRDHLASVTREDQPVITATEHHFFTVLCFDIPN